MSNTRLRAEEPRTRFARQPARWFAPTPTVPESAFQHAGEPFPGHWRRFPAPWPTLDPADPELRDTLAAALDELPATWREVIIARDGLGRDAREISDRLGLTARQQRTILNRARARLRERLAGRLTPDADG
ncbi:MAG TPA: sigma factor-like helix-turn-helix DNA-binding protein [Jatrophihabitans sp.]|nr:sigma factor-like helix-turn-helix DNA-binding protein [Jatrophihabitans sp.]